MRQPFTVSSLCTTLLVLAAVSSVYTGKDFGLRHNITVGACGVLAIFLVFCAVQFPDGAFVRPNVIVWRVVKGLTLLYMCLLVFLLCQSVEDVRSALSIIDPTTEEILYETNYAEDCRLITPDHPDGALGNILERIDVFVLAHFFGWLVKALIIRNEKLLWVLSLAFEWAEISLRHILPNFWECWWDHLLLDVFGCNLLGIYCGLWLAERLQMREYKDWIFHSRSKPFYYHSRLLSQLLPENYSQHHWPKFMRNGTVRE
ncbi:MAG: hypothetical protein KVP17_001570 [Porospora cf. gigantea B]|uniref:uncharacterized protein n=1 Tax=Porospora cf. gigantea B TaxID=2853592 RepID=UPI0035719C2B|nr:MAG: hypothetical protein KVP17_001570 [Porospora cf. gigantea B]